MLDANKTKMKYSLQGQTITVYEKDDDGNPKFYETSDGEKVYFETEVQGFSEPVEFCANIAFSGGEAQIKEYGFDVSDFDAIILTEKNEFLFKKGDLIWLDSDVEYREEGVVDDKSADFIIVGIKPALHSTKYMLRAIEK